MRAGRAEDRIDRRQALPRHRVDDRDLGMIEDRIGEMNRAADNFGRIATAGTSASTAAAANAHAWYRRRGVGIAIRRELERRDS